VLKIRHYLVACLLLLVPFALIAKQPDLGTAILVGAAGFYVIFFAGLPWQVIVGLALTAAARLHLSCGRCCTTTSANAF
jgi:rod shape determining protein RodA